MDIPLVDLRAQHSVLQDQMARAIYDCIGSSAFVGGAYCSAFAYEFANYCGGGHVALCGSGTDALGLAIWALLGKGDGTGEIITVGNTFFATIEAIVNAGYRPVFVDVRPDTLLMDIESVVPAITARTRAILPVHLYGQMVAMDRVAQIARSHDLAVIEDAAQAHGALWKGKGPGQYSDAACFSFYVSKNLGALGEGGAVFSKNSDLIAHITRLANHGSSEKYVHEEVGTNSRLDGLQAAFLSIKLRYLDAWNERRRQVAEGYNDRLGDVEGIQLPHTDAGAEHVFHLYVVQLRHREHVLQSLHAAGIHAAIHYPVPVFEQPAFRSDAASLPDLQVTRTAARRIVSLPLYPEMADWQLDAVCDVLRDALAEVCGTTRKTRKA